MAKKTPVIKLEDVWKTYYIGDNEIHALRGLTLEVYKGDFVVVMGPSGSGKSTSVNMIGCLDVPSRGRVFLDKHDISKLTESRLAQIRGKKIGFIFQQFNLISTLNAIENVALPMMFQNVPNEKRLRKAKDLLIQVGLKERMFNKPNELSGGQQQRVAIARALSNDPEIILADEPTGNLDSKTGDMVMGFLQDLHAKGATVITVTHDEHVAGCAERVERLQDGVIVKSEKKKKGERKCLGKNKK